MSVLTPNMSLIQPSVGVEPGPDWAEELNTSLDRIDGHDHSEGSGVQIGVAGLNIQGDLSINGNNLDDIRALRLSALDLVDLDSPDNASVVVSGVDLYFRDGNGTNIRLTQSGSIVGTTGSISGLASPASASYVAANSTFVWQSAANTAADMDMASIILRPASASAPGITIAPPNALASAYTLTLPLALSGTNNALTLTSTAGVQSYLSLGSANTVLRVNSAGTALEYSAVDTANIAADAITTAKIVDGAVTTAKLAASNYVTTTFTSTSAVNGASAIVFSGLSFTATGGRPVTVSIVGTAAGSRFSAFNAIAQASMYFTVSDGTNNFGGQVDGILTPSAAASSWRASTPLCFTFTYVPSAGAKSFSFTIKENSPAGTGSCLVDAGRITIFES
jgi:hypothetical protein